MTKYKVVFETKAEISITISAEAEVIDTAVEFASNRGVPSLCACTPRDFKWYCKKGDSWEEVMNIDAIDELKQIATNFNYTWDGLLRCNCYL